MNYLVSLIALSGLVLIFAALPVLVVPLFEDAFTSSAPSSVRGVEQHVVLCNYGPREEVLIDELDERGVTYVIVEADREVANDLYTSGYTVMFGDPKSDATLRRAQLEHADTLIANINDEVNPTVLLSAREVNPDVRTVSLSEDPDTADYHRYAGADHVLSPKQILGEQLAGKAVGSFDPEAIEAIEIDEDFDIAEFPLQNGSKLIGQTIEESDILERTGAAVVGRAITAALSGAKFEYTTIDIADHTTADVVGDATERQTLREAGIIDASTVVLALPDDTAAIFATFAIRELNPQIEIIARANEQENVSKLYRAGADYVLSLATVTGRMLASIVLDEEIISPGTQLKLVWTTAPGATGRKRSLWVRPTRGVHPRI